MEAHWNSNDDTFGTILFELLVWPTSIGDLSWYRWICLIEIFLTISVVSLSKFQYAFWVFFFFFLFFFSLSALLSFY